jgi:hypothetical protein
LREAGCQLRGFAKGTEANRLCQMILAAQERQTDAARRARIARTGDLILDELRAVETGRRLNDIEAQMFREKLQRYGM